MAEWIRFFNELSGEDFPSAGGKGGTLAQLYQAGYPVPDGFVILPQAFSEQGLMPEAWSQVQTHLGQMRSSGNGDGFAVRSSALSEDSAQASFAGEFETVLDVHTDEAIMAAIGVVHHSRASERVKAYTRAKGIAPAVSEGDQEIAVVIQRMIPAQISGVLFTADPVTGSFDFMTGNFIHGLGEQLVSGEANAETFTLSRPKGKYAGPSELKRYGRSLYKLATRLEKELENPQDIEWCVAGGELFLLQSRPITTLQGVNLATGEWNDSLRGDFLWTNVNIGEARPDVMTPLTWTLGQMLRGENQPLPGNYPWVGNIGGRTYMNISMTLSMFRSFGMSPQKMLKRMEALLGPVPKGVDIPMFPFPLSTIFVGLPGFMKIRRRERAAAENLDVFLATNAMWCREIVRKCHDVQNKEALLVLWQEEIKPYFVDAGFMMGASLRPMMKATGKLSKQLVELVGEADANSLLSNLSDDENLLASLGPVVGIWKVSNGEMSREEYLLRYGHRGPHEMELSAPRPDEDPGWLEAQLEVFNKSPVDVDALLANRRSAFDAAWGRFQEQYPRKVKSMQRRLEKVPPAARLRESFRSEVTRVYAVALRGWALRAGDLTGLGDDVFFLTYDELLNLLAGEESATQFIPARKETHARYDALPPYPTTIRGRFDPFAWATDPDRRGDIFDAQAPQPMTTSDTITGFAGAAGRVEGIVRCLVRYEESDQLQPGEILVAVTTNVGWTPLFPRAAAVITDVGVPLSHAAIVARELGIPAVVGCVDATTRLKTGDRVRVDGGRGIVEILRD
jgi:pyruvate,water dikinase